MTLDALITFTLGELSQLSGYWSKKFKCTGRSEQALRNIVPYTIKVKILNKKIVSNFLKIEPVC